MARVNNIINALRNLKRKHRINVKKNKKEHDNNMQNRPAKNQQDLHKERTDNLLSIYFSEIKLRL